MLVTNVPIPSPFSLDGVASQSPMLAPSGRVRM